MVKQQSASIGIGAIQFLFLFFLKIDSNPGKGDVSLSKSIVPRVVQMYN